MLVPRTFKAVKKSVGEKTECYSCPLLILCKKFVNQETGEIITGLTNRLSYSESRFVNENAPVASYCRKHFPDFKIVETTPKEIHRLVGRGGNTIVEANSWIGMIGKTFIVMIISFFVIALIGLICSSIGI